MESHWVKFATVSLLVLCAVSIVVGARKPCDFPAIFNFGDSNSDTGGMSAAFGQIGPPCGETFFGRPVGRYSDGRVVIDFIAQTLGLPYLNAFLDAVGSNFTHGANFATGGSTVRPPNTTLQQSGLSPFSLNIQKNQFNDFVRRSQFGPRALLPNLEDTIPNALFTFDIGQNDLAASYFQNMTVDQVKDYVPDVLGQFVAVIKDIYDYPGGRIFWIHNTSPVGCLPYVIVGLPVPDEQVDYVGCSTPFNEVAQFFNEKLKEAVKQLRMDLPLAAITYVDVYSIKYNLISQAKKHGFEHPFRACCGRGGKFNYNKKVGCCKVHGEDKFKGKSCKNPSKLISWDGAHFTEAANKWVFDKIVDGSFSEPKIPLKMACHRTPNAL